TSVYAGTGATYPVFIKIANPYFADDTQDEENRSELTQIDQAYAELLKQHGYDGVIGYRNDAVLWAIPFDATQIKSAIGNNGAFNPADPDIRFSAREQAQTDTPAFKEWFGDSKIVKDGKPLVVYHGT